MGNNKSITTKDLILLFSDAHSSTSSGPTFNMQHYYIKNLQILLLRKLPYKKSWKLGCMAKIITKLSSASTMTVAVPGSTPGSYLTGPTFNSALVQVNTG